MMRRTQWVASALAFGVVLLLAGCAADDDPAGATPTTTTASPGPAATPAVPQTTQPATPATRFVPRVGECLDARKDSVVGPASIVPCDQPHDDEVYAVFALDGDAFPGADAVQQRADAGCRDLFADFVGVPADSSQLGWYSFQPSEASWAQSDRDVACAVWNPDDLVTGTLEGADY